MGKLTKKEEIELLLLLQEEEYDKYRNNFYQFCVYMDPVFFTPGKWHLKEIAEAFQEVADGKIKKLAVSLSPRAGKSYIASLFCAWMLGKFYLDGSVMRNSYAAKLAEKFSKDIRDGIMVNEKYKKLFPKVNISKTNSAVDGWSINTNTQPAYFCAGVGGPITGFGCKTLAVLDDPLKNIEEALSETIIENVWNWYTSTHLSRLETGCPEIHIATRWSKKDPIGRLTDPDSPEYSPDCKVICIPALIDGKSFCEEVKTTEEYLDIKRVTDELIWEAEFMQNPIEEKGLLFPSGELKRFSLSELKKEPDGIIGVVDPADQGTDFLCALIGKRYGNYTYLTDVVFTQDGVEITEPLVAQMAIDTKCRILKVESNAGGKAFADNIRKLIKPKAHCSVIFESTSQNKETKILMAAGYIKEYFYFREDYQPGSDYDKFMRQFMSYVKLAKNKHDDAADCVSQMAIFMQNNFRVEKSKPANEYVGTFTYEMLKMKGLSDFEIRKAYESGELNLVGGSHIKSKAKLRISKK